MCIQENRCYINKSELGESLKKLYTILCMDLQCFPVNFCTDFPLKVKYSDFHKIYINIFKENLDIYKNHPSVTDCRLYYVFRLTGAIDFSNLYLTYFVFHDTWSESLTTLSESQYLYQEDYHSMVQCAALNCTVKSGHGISTYLFPQIAKLKKNMDSTFENRRISAKSVHKTLWETFREGSVCCQSGFSGVNWVPIKNKHVDSGSSTIHFWSLEPEN
jgi:hypothetical protein